MLSLRQGFSMKSAAGCVDPTSRTCVYTFWFKFLQVHIYESQFVATITKKVCSAVGVCGCLIYQGVRLRRIICFETGVPLLHSNRYWQVLLLLSCPYSLLSALLSFQEGCCLSRRAPPGVCIMASLLRVVAASCSAPVFSGLSCAKLQSSSVVKSSGLRFFRTHQALGRCAAPGEDTRPEAMCLLWNLGSQERTLLIN